MGWGRALECDRVPLPRHAHGERSQIKAPNLSPDEDGEASNDPLSWGPGYRDCNALPPR